MLKEELKAGPRSSAGLEKLMQSCQSLGIEQLDMKEEVRSFQTKKTGAHFVWKCGFTFGVRRSFIPRGSVPEVFT